MTRIIVAGGCGFIGGNFVHAAVDRGWQVVTVDAMTYAASPRTLDAVADRPNHRFVKGSITDRALMSRLLDEVRPSALINFAAATHVDRSIDDPSPFLENNVIGVFTLLEACRSYLKAGGGDGAFRLLHVSTDEVFGSADHVEAFDEDAPHRPSSPYSASKAAADDMVHAWHCTYGLPTLITNCTNNYGPYQFPEKLVPHMILRALAGKPLPVYGDGRQRRDWLHVSDHVRALMAVLENGRLGQTYNIAGRTEIDNITVVRQICAHLDRAAPLGGGRSYAEQITHVTDRPGHDRRYALDCGKLEHELGISPLVGLEQGLGETIDWYLANRWWWDELVSAEYRLDRIGLADAAEEGER